MYRLRWIRTAYKAAIGMKTKLKLLYLTVYSESCECLHPQPALELPVHRIFFRKESE